MPKVKVIPYDKEKAIALVKEYKLPFIPISWPKKGIPDHYLNKSKITINGYDLKTLRRKLNLTQKMVLTQLESMGYPVCRISLNNWEHGKYRPQKIVAAALHAYYTSKIRERERAVKWK